VLITGKVNGITVCMECNTPLCVYAAATLVVAYSFHLNVIYTTLLSPIVEIQYYSGTCTLFPPVC